MKYLIKKTGFETFDKEEAISKVTQVYLDYYELDNRSRKRVEAVYREMIEHEISEFLFDSFVSYGGIRLTLIK